MIELDATRRSTLRGAAERFLAANRVSLVVGFVLVPLLFGGIGGALWAVIPWPFGTYIGGGIVGAGALTFLFLLLYAWRTSRRQPFVALATIRGWRETVGRYGETAHHVDVHVIEARALEKTAVGAELAQHRDEDRTWLLTSRNLFTVAPAGQEVLVVCMPTGEVVGIEAGGRLVTA